MKGKLIIFLFLMLTLFLLWIIIILQFYVLGGNMLNLLNTTFIEMISRPGIIAGIICVVLGTAIAILAVRLTRAIRKASEYNPNDILAIILKSVGLVIVVVGFILIAVMSFN